MIPLKLDWISMENENGEDDDLKYMTLGAIYKF
jgi:hypothetical protein